MKFRKSIEDLETELSRLVSDAENFGGGEVSAQREEAWDYYHGEPFGDEVSGRSDIVTREVYDAVEWVKPELMKIFFSGDRVVEFTPQGPEDVEAAEQDTDYINYVFLRQNPGFRIGLDVIGDALLQKVGIAKWYWDDSFNTTEEEYENLTYEEALYLEQNHPDMTLKYFEEKQVERDGLIVTETEACFTVRTSKPQARVCAIPPEEFIISRDARDIKSARFVAHRRQVTRSEVLEMGFTEKDLDGVVFSDVSEVGIYPERSARHRFDGTETWNSNSSGDPSQDTAWLYESYFYSDVDGKGIAKLVKTISIGNTILEAELAQEKPFAAASPLYIQHKFYGLSFHDILKDLQKIKSSVVRSMLDSAQFSNHGRFGVVEGQVNIDDLVSSRPGGIVRMKTPNALIPLQSQSLDGNTFGLIDYIDRLAESRSGVSSTSIGLDPNALRSNVAASTVNATMTAAMQKRDLMARIIAETFFKELFLGLHGLIKRHQKEADYVRLRETFVKVDPTAWKDRADAVVTVGLGNGSKDSQVQTYMQMANLLQMAGTAVPQIITPENVYNFVLEGFKIAGWKHGTKFVTDPATVEPPQPEPDPKLIVAQMKDQTDKQKLAETQRSNMKKEELAEAELVRKTMADEQQAALDLAELGLESKQGRAVGIGNK